MPSPEEVLFSMSLAGVANHNKSDSTTFGCQLHTADTRPAAAGAAKRQSIRTVSKRRSVSGMRGLMPLALSPSPSLSPSCSADEGMGQMADGYFPEVLARDLDSATELFTAKNMTAGSPVTVLPVDKTKRKHRSCPTRPSIPIRNQAASARVQSLGAIQERNVIVSFIEQDEQHQHQLRSLVDDATSDIESNYGSEASGSIAPPSFRYRERSVATAATSITTGSWKLLHSPKRSPALDELSWIENDSDEEESEEEPPEDILDSLAPRPPTPPESPATMPGDQTRMESRGPWSCNNPLHHKSHSIGGATPIIPPQRTSSRQAAVGDLRRSSSTRVKGSDSDDFYRAQPYSSTQLSTPRSKTRVLHSCAGHEDNDTILNVPALVETPAMSDHDLDSDDDLDLHPGLSSWNRPNTVYIRPSPPPSPLPSVQAWLNNSVRPYTPCLPSDDLSRAVPLPPDVIETLRVSIACFPETMLLSSSLTVETIRTYSRKIRHPNLDHRDLSHPNASHSTKKSVWRRVVSYRRGSSTSEYNQPRESATSNLSSLQSSASSTSLDTPPPWMPLKHIFGCCSDYICDALYAHIVAYNYISALVPRNNSPPKPAHKPSAQGTDAQTEDIPKKAASVLGLSSTTEPNSNTLGAQRLARKLSMARLSWAPGKDQQGGMSTAQEQTARDIQAGLKRCVVRLVATAKLMAESGTGEETMVEMDAKEVDILFTRSLCEIVRISEEAAGL